MKKIFAFLICVSFFAASHSQSFRSTTNSNTAQQVNSGNTSLYHFNVINRSSDTIYTKFYDKATIATYTNTPVITLMCLPLSQIWWEDIAFRGTPFVYNFNYGCWVRTVKGSADTYSVSPSILPIIEANY